VIEIKTDVPIFFLQIREAIPSALPPPPSPKIAATDNVDDTQKPSTVVKHTYLVGEYYFSVVNSTVYVSLQGGRFAVHPGLSTVAVNINRKCHSGINYDVKTTKIDWTVILSLVETITRAI